MGGDMFTFVAGAAGGVGMCLAPGAPPPVCPTDDIIPMVSDNKVAEHRQQAFQRKEKLLEDKASRRVRVSFRPYLSRSRCSSLSPLSSLFVVVSSTLSFSLSVGVGLCLSVGLSPCLVVSQCLSVFAGGCRDLFATVCMSERASVSANDRACLSE
jgi:hypothetical protein